MSNALTGERITTEQAQQGYIDAGTTGQQLANELTQGEIDFFRKTGMLPGRMSVSTPRQTPVLDARDTLQEIMRGKSGGIGGMNTPYTPHEARQLAQTHNARALELERSTGKPQAYILTTEKTGPFAGYEMEFSPEIVMGLDEYQRRQPAQQPQETPLNE